MRTVKQTDRNKNTKLNANWQVDESDKMYLGLIKH